MNNKILISLAALLILDILWLTYYMGPRYKIMIPIIQQSPMKVNYMSATIAYTFMAILLVQYVIKYNFKILETFLFGICLYGVYDFTCGAVFTKWDFTLALIDVIWGGFVFAITKYIHDSL